MAALTALMLDGGVFSSGTTVNIHTMKGGGGSDNEVHDVTENSNSADVLSQGINSHKDEDSSFSTPSPPPLPGSHLLTSLYAQRVQCMALGPPPCMSRAIVPKYITSLVCGDDLVPRAQAGALQGLTKR